MNNQRHEEKARLIAMISRDEMEFLDRISKDCQFTTGHKLTRQDIVSAILDVVAALPITGRDIKTKEELKAHIEKLIQDKLSKTEKQG
jgi:hypothetical protein